MGIFDAFKSLFGRPNHHQESSKENHPPVNTFKKPDWANEDEDSDDELVYSHPLQGENIFTFSVFSNPIEMSKYFEHQMSQMIKNFEESFSRDLSIFGNHSNNNLIESFFSQTPFFGQENHPALLPPPSGGEEDNNQSLRNKCFKPNTKIPKRIEDNDLDDEYKNGKISLFKPTTESPQIYSHGSKPQAHSYSSQVFTKFIRRPDGSTEEIQTKKIGDKSYSKVIRTEANGTQHIHEDIVNIDEDKLKDFQQNMGHIEMPKIDFKDFFNFKF